MPADTDVDVIALGKEPPIAGRTGADFDAEHVIPFRGIRATDRHVSLERDGCLPPGFNARQRSSSTVSAVRDDERPAFQSGRSGSYDDVIVELLDFFDYSP